MAEPFSLKDHLFNKSKVMYLAGLLAAADGRFDERQFVADVMERLLDLELKDRIRWIAKMLVRHLPADFEVSVAIIIKSLPPPLDPSKSDNDFGSFIFAPFGEYIATQGCVREYLEMSLTALEAVTMRFSMEDAIRHFLRAFPAETLAQCELWVRHEHYHVRRLVSEGTRPLLPWSGRVPLQSSDTLPLLTMLHTDATRFVTRSVANHLNDIAKKEPQAVVDVLKHWQVLGQQNEKELRWMTKHALRTLIKQGNTAALALLGYGRLPEVTVGRFSAGESQQKIAPGDTLALTADISSHDEAAILVDYVIHFVKKNGSTAPKVFKWKTLVVKKGEIVTLVKRHWLKADATTFTLYSGAHRVDLHINGEKYASFTFTLQ